MASKDLFRISPSNISSELTQSTILNVLQAKNGELWISTLDGISRYDGNRLINYRREKPGKQHIDSVKISKIIESPSGNVYAATHDQGLLKYDRLTDSFSATPYRNQPDIPDQNISTAFYARNGFIWMSESDGRVARISPEANLVQYFQIEQGDHVTDFSEDLNGGIWISTHGGTVYVKRPGTNKLAVILKSGSCSTTPLEIVELVVDQNSRLWIGTSGSGLFQKSLNDSICTTFPLPGTGDFQSENATIHEILQDHDRKTTWIASDQGLYQISDKQNTNHFHSGNSNLINNEVTAISLGARGVMWVGTYAGLDLVAKSNFEIFNQSTDSRLHSIVAINSSRKRKTWIASYDGILIYDESSGTYSDVFDVYPNVPFKNERIMSLLITDEEAWIGYRSTGLEHYLFDKQLLTTYSKKSNPAISSNAISSILKLVSGETLIGTYGGGLNIISNDGTVEVLSHKEHQPSIMDDKVISLFQDSNELIWVGTESGLLRFDLATHEFHSLNSHVIDAGWSTERIVLSMRETSNGELWLGTMHSGLYRLRPKEGSPNQLSADHFPLKSLTSSSTVYAAEIDSGDNIWVSTNSGISRIDQNSGERNHFSRSNGLIETEFDFGASHKDSKGRLYFGGSNGYNRFDPDNIELDSPPPPVVLTGLIIAGREPELPVALQDLDIIELAHKDYFITIIFSALDFLDPGKNQYSYKLEGFDPDWIDNDTRNSATYTNLPAGEYVFRVRGANSAGVWNYEGASIRIKVFPSRWLSWWALTVYVLVGLWLIYSAARIYHDRIVTRQANARADEWRNAANSANDDLQEQLEIQDELIKSVYRHNVDTLGLIRDFIALQMDFFDDEDMREAIEGSQNRVLALSHLESCMYYQGNALYADMNKYMDLIIPLTLESALIPVESITTINKMGNRLVPAEIATHIAIISYELVQNCVRHAFEHGRPANYIQISLEAQPGTASEGQRLTLVVKDNGVGIPDGIATLVSGTSGLAIVNTLVEKLEGTLEVFAQDGTRIVVTIPDAPDLMLPYGGLQELQ